MEMVLLLLRILRVNADEKVCAYMRKKRITRKIRTILDPIENTFHIWWDDTKKSVESWEADESWDVLCLDKNGRVIGFEKIGFFPKEIDPLKHFKKPLKDAYGKFKLIKGEIRAELPTGITELEKKD